MQNLSPARWTGTPLSRSPPCSVVQTRCRWPAALACHRRASQKQCWGVLMLEFFRGWGDQTSMAVGCCLSSTLLNSPVKPKCQWCSLKPSGELGRSQRRLHLTGVPCAAFVSKEGCESACRSGVWPAEWPNEYSLLKPSQK